jgi:hypothetical protein
MDPVTITPRVRQTDGRTLYIVEQWINPWGRPSGRYAWETRITRSARVAARIAERWRQALAERPA